MRIHTINYGVLLLTLGYALLFMHFCLSIGLMQAALYLVLVNAK
jgi:hypothetical protein